MPKFRLGAVAPQPSPVIERAPYQFYRVVPHGVMPVTTSLLGHMDHTLESVKKSMANWWDCVDLLVRHRVNWIELEGVPVSAILGRDRVLELVDQARKRTGVPVSSRLESALAAMQHLGVRRVTLGSRWRMEVNEAVANYLAAVDIRVVGQTTRGQRSAQALAMSQEEGMKLALDLGREAMALAPQADALFLPGGAWVALHAIVPLEKEYGKPVFTNINGTSWNALRRTNVVSPVQGWGRLLGA